MYTDKGQVTVGLDGESVIVVWRQAPSKPHAVKSVSKQINFSFIRACLLLHSRLVISAEKVEKATHISIYLAILSCYRARSL